MKRILLIAAILLFSGCSLPSWGTNYPPEEMKKDINNCKNNGFEAEVVFSGLDYAPMRVDCIYNPTP